MTANAKSMENLQTALSMELSAVHQYLLHAHILEDWGLDALAAKMREEMQEELGHASVFMDRILFLGGDPKVEPAKAASRSTSLKAMFEADLEDERSAVLFYSDAAAEALTENDVGSRALFERIAIDEEGHMDWLQTQLDLIERIGEPAYVARHMSVTAEGP
ncbi:bacterioferritin [Bauldia sp.]|uniref:bacterioferritin n=1 Tax=Bauldia sp. TaxID=2575872 RepID=UPI003BAD87FF